MSEQTVSNLIHRLRRQYPLGVTTIAPCPQCEKPSRGGDLCHSCITRELADMTGQAQVCHSLDVSLRNVRDYVDMLLEPDL